jgi:hypothetical protein
LDSEKVNFLRVPDGQTNMAPSGPARRLRIWPWAVLGSVAAGLLALTGSRVGPLPGSGDWWLGLPHRAGGAAVLGAFYAAAAVLVVAWLALGSAARAGRLGRPAAAGIVAAWGTPLLIGPPLFSRDVYSYMAQGLLADRGLDPYVWGPAALGPGFVAGSVARPWLSTPAPYGPFFVGLCRAASWAFGRSIFVEVTAFRVLSLLGVGLLVVALPRVARQLGVEAGTALWLGVLSPLSLFSFVASGHNDALMVGLIVLGVALVLESRPTWALVACALATTVKVSALAAVALLAIYLWRSTERDQRLRHLPVWVAAGLGPLVGTTYLSGLGWGWLSPTVLSVPGHLLLGYAPAPAIGLTIFHGLDVVGVHLSRGPVVAGTEAVFAVGGVILALLLARGADLKGLPVRLGLLLLAAVLAGPSLWPWYLTWSLVLLGATRYQDSWPLIATCALGAFLVAPAGTPILRGPDYVVVTAIVVAFGLRLARRGRWRVLWEPGLA